MPLLERSELSDELVPEALIASWRVSICTIANRRLSVPPTEGMFDRFCVVDVLFVLVVVLLKLDLASSRSPEVMLKCSSTLSDSTE